MTGALLALLVGAAFLTLGLAALLALRRGRRQARMAADWPMAEGVVTASSLVAEPDSDPAGGRRYRAAIAYAYRVDGRAYTGARLGFGVDAAGGSRAHHEALVKALPVGARVGVRYRPDDPSEATLASGLHDDRGAAPLLGALVLAALALAALATVLFVRSGGTGSDEILSRIVFL